MPPDQRREAIVAAALEVAVSKGLASTTVRDVAAVIFAANCGTTALIFGFTPFTTQIGLQYWFLGGMLFGLTLALKRKGEVV